MINVYVVSGFLGAGKTTFIQKILNEKKFSKVMLLENEFGEIGVDAAFFDKSLKIKEINNGCICCSLQGDFESALEEIEEMDISDLIVEPSGVGKLSEVLSVLKADDDFRVVSHICIVDVKTALKYHRNFKEYFDDQVKAANALVLSHTDVADDETIKKVVAMLKELNPEVTIVDKGIADYDINDLMDLIVAGHDSMMFIEDHDEHEHHHHHDHDHDHHHHHDDDDDEDELFKNYVLRPECLFTIDKLEEIFKKVPEDIIRIKGFVQSEEGTLYFNYVLNEYHIYVGEKREDSLVSIIGTVIDHQFFDEAFHE